MSVKMPQEKRRNRALLYENIVNEKFSGGGNNVPHPFFRLRDWETSDIRR